MVQKDLRIQETLSFKEKDLTWTWNLPYCWLLSRAPVVAKCDRKPVFSSWTPCCSNVAPVEFEIEFASVRHLNPQQFAEKLSSQLRICGVVAGENYRFGYKASLWWCLWACEAMLRVLVSAANIINSLMDKNQICGTAETEEGSPSQKNGYFRGKDKETRSS